MSEDERERQVADAWARECDAHKETKHQLEEANILLANLQQPGMVERLQRVFAATPEQLGLAAVMEVAAESQKTLEEKLLELEAYKILLDREQTLCTTFAKQVTELQGKLEIAKLDVQAARRERDEVSGQLTDLEMELRLAQGDVCWHCHIVLAPVDPSHCDSCPAFNCCEDDLCNEPGCAVDLTEIREDGRLSKGLSSAS